MTEEQQKRMDLITEWQERRSRNDHWGRGIINEKSLGIQMPDCTIYRGVLLVGNTMGTKLFEAVDCLLEYELRHGCYGLRAVAFGNLVVHAVWHCCIPEVSRVTTCSDFTADVRNSTVRAFHMDRGIHEMD